ncbi:MAG: hydroxyethylthiazole kinase [Treponema sp.]|nr:hydroxyethylthiazole kinase [Treponema sp.]
MQSVEEIRKKVAKAVEDVRAQNPMAASITNSVTIELVANAQLAVGGSAAMVYLPDEGEAMAEAGKSFYINMGTLLPVYAESLPRTTRRLAELKRPWVLDPVGIGIGSLRRELLRNFSDKAPGVIRGNASEIIALASLWGIGSGKKALVRGVDSTDSVLQAKEDAMALARHTGGAVAVSGPDDFVTDGETSLLISGGSSFMPMITGAGCSLGGVMAIYACVADPLTAAVTGSCIYKFAGKAAHSKCRGPASFRTEFIDSLYNATADDVANNPLKLDILGGKE